MQRIIVILCMLQIAATTDQEPSIAELQKVPGNALDLQTAVNAVLENSPDLEVAKQKLVQAEQGFYQVLSNHLPKLSVSGSYTRFNKATEISMPDFTTMQVGTTPDPNTGNLPITFGAMMEGVFQPLDMWSLQAQLTVPLIIPQLYFAMGQVRQGIKAARLGTDFARQQIIYGTVMLYWGALAAEDYKDISQAAYDMTVEHLNAAKMKLKTGTGTSILVTQAELSVEQARRDLIDAKEQYRLVIEKLEIMMGQPIKQLKDMALPKLDLPQIDQAIKVSLENRKDYRAQLHNYEAAQKGKKAAWMSYAPSLVATGNYTAQNVENFNGDQTSWNAMLILNWDIFTGLSRVSEVQRSNAAVIEQHASVESQKLKIKQEINDVIVELHKARIQALVAKKQLELAEKNAEAMEVAYNNGAISNIEYDDAIRSLTQARLFSNGTRFQIAIALTTLLNAQGKVEEILEIAK